MPFSRDCRCKPFNPMKERYREKTCTPIRYPVVDTVDLRVPIQAGTRKKDERKTRSRCFKSSLLSFSFPLKPPPNNGRKRTLRGVPLSGDWILDAREFDIAIDACKMWRFWGVLSHVLWRLHDRVAVVRRCVQRVYDAKASRAERVCR